MNWCGSMCVYFFHSFRVHSNKWGSYCVHEIEKIYLLCLVWIIFLVVEMWVILCMWRLKNGGKLLYDIDKCAPVFWWDQGPTDNRGISVCAYWILFKRFIFLAEIFVTCVYWVSGNILMSFCTVMYYLMVYLSFRTKYYAIIFCR